MKPVFLMAFCAIFLFSGCASQEDVNMLHNRLMSMDNRMRAMDRNAIDLGKKHSALEAEMANRDRRPQPPALTSSELKCVN